jgi:hypothetical protein
MSLTITKNTQTALKPTINEDVFTSNNESQAAEGNGLFEKRQLNQLIGKTGNSLML